MDSDRLMEVLEDNDAKFVLSFEANGEVYAKVEGSSLESVLEQSHKLDDIDTQWATDYLSDLAESMVDSQAKEALHGTD